VPSSIAFVLLTFLSCDWVVKRFGAYSNLYRYIIHARKVLEMLHTRNVVVRVERNKLTYFLLFLSLFRVFRHTMVVGLILIYFKYTSTRLRVSTDYYWIDYVNTENSIIEVILSLLVVFYNINIVFIPISLSSFVRLLTLTTVFYLF